MSTSAAFTAFAAAATTALAVLALAFVMGRVASHPVGHGAAHVGSFYPVGSLVVPADCGEGLSF